jgi:hypothetical protein
MQTRRCVGAAMARAMLLIGLLGFSGATARVLGQNVVTTAKRDFQKAKDDVKAARNHLIDATERVAIARRLVNARQAALLAQTESTNYANKSIAAAKASYDQAYNDQMSAIAAARNAANFAKTLKDAYNKATFQALTSELLAYDFTQDGTLTFNFATGAFDVRVDHNGGLPLRLSDIDTLFKGATPRPQLDVVDLAIDAASLKISNRSNYAQVRETFLKDHNNADVYVISNRLLDWADPERFGIKTGVPNPDVGDGLTDGSRQFQLEYEDFVTWLKSSGGLAPGLKMDEVFTDLVKTGRSAVAGISAHGIIFEYSRRFEPAGTTKIPTSILRVLSSRREVVFDQGGFEYKTPRTGFAIVRERGGSASVSAAIERLGDRQAVPQIDLIRLVASLANVDNAALRPILSKLTPGSSAIEALDPDLRNSAFKCFAITKAELIARAEVSPAAIDLRGTESSRQLQALVTRLAQGNRGSAVINSIEIEPNSQRLNASFTLRHQQVWGTLRQAVSDLSFAHKNIKLTQDELTNQLAKATQESARKARDAAEIKAEVLDRTAKAARARFDAALMRLNEAESDIKADNEALARAKADHDAAKRNLARSEKAFETAKTDLERSGRAVEQAEKNTEGAQQTFTTQVRRFLDQADPALRAMEAAAQRMIK